MTFKILIIGFLLLGVAIGFLIGLLFSILGRIDLEEQIEKAIEVLKLCNSKCSKEVIDILEGVNKE